MVRVDSYSLLLCTENQVKDCMMSFSSPGQGEHLKTCPSSFPFLFLFWQIVPLQEEPGQGLCGAFHFLGPSGTSEEPSHQLYMLTLCSSCFWYTVPLYGEAVQGPQHAILFPRTMESSASLFTPLPAGTLVNIKIDHCITWARFSQAQLPKKAKCGRNMY